MPAVWAILSCCLFGIVFVNGDAGGDCLTAVTPQVGGNPEVWKSAIEDPITAKRLQENADFQSKMFAAPTFYDWFCTDPQNNRAVCKNKAACAFLVSVTAQEDGILKSQQFLENYPLNNMKLIDNDYTASDPVMLKEVFTPTSTFAIIASNDTLLVNTMTNEAIIKAFVGNKATFDNVMKHKDFVAALENNDKLRTKLVSSVQAFDALTKFFDKHKPLVLAQLVFDSNPKLKGIFRMIFLIPMVITLVLTLFTLIMMWGACYPWKLIRKPGEPDIEDEVDEKDKKGKDKDKDKKKKDKDDKTGNEETGDEDEKDKKKKGKKDKKDKDKDSDKEDKKGSDKDKDKDKDKKKKKDKKDKKSEKDKDDEEDEGDDKKKKKDKKKGKKGKKDDEDE